MVLVVTSPNVVEVVRLVQHLLLNGNTVSKETQGLPKPSTVVNVTVVAVGRLRGWQTHDKNCTLF